jgi:transcriptional regulator with XRE-family HTH domain
MTIENERMELKFSKILSIALRGKNISSVAREVDMPRSMLHDWAKSKRVPSLNNIEYIKRLADYLGLSLEEILIGETGKKTISSVSFQDDQRQYRI